MVMTTTMMVKITTIMVAVILMIALLHARIVIITNNHQNKQQQRQKEKVILNHSSPKYQLQLLPFCQHWISSQQKVEYNRVYFGFFHTNSGLSSAIVIGLDLFPQFRRNLIKQALIWFQD